MRVISQTSWEVQWYLLIVTCYIAFQRNSATHVSYKDLSISSLMKRLLRGYDRHVSPHGAHPTEVKLGIYINSFYSISEQTMDYSVNIYLRQSWTDPRLKFHPRNNKSEEEIKLADGMWKKIWIPDVTFRNEKKADFHTITVPNRLLRLKSNGDVWYASKVSATLACQMNLWKYPFDTQQCPMMMESFGFTTDTVNFGWIAKAVDQEKDMSLPQFELAKIDQINCSQTYATGTYPCLQVNFILKRNIGFYMIQLYIPSILIVILSWVSFWISCESAPARVSIGLLTVLTITTQSASARSSLPRVSYIKAIDVWMSACLLFVFAAFLQFAAVNVFSRKEKKIVKENKKPSKNIKDKVICDESTALQMDEANFENNDKTIGSKHSSSGTKQFASKLCASVTLKDPFARQKARFIDKLSRRLFPLTFFIFLIVYWAFYAAVND